MNKTKLDIDKFYQKINQAFQNTVIDFGEMQKEEMESVKWDWPRVTIRQNGTIVYSPRDILDTGTLYNALSINQNNLHLYTYSWNTDYAVFVHNGAQSTPARPWITEAINNNDITLVFLNHLKNEL
jgi:hypothetical protein